LPSKWSSASRRTHIFRATQASGVPEQGCDSKLPEQTTYFINSNYAKS